MAEHQEVHHSHEDEIDLIDMIGGLWEGRWLLTAVTVLSMLAGGFYIWGVSHPVKITTELATITPEHAVPFNALNTLLGQLGEGAPQVLTPESLLNKTIGQLNRGDVIEASYRSLKTEFSQRMLNAQLVSVLGSSNVQAPEDGSNWFWDVSVSLDDDAVDWTIDVLNRSSVAVRNDINLEIDQWLKSVEQKKTNSLEDLNLRKSRILDGYAFDIEKRKKLLEEQAKIARTLGLKENSLLSQITSVQNSFVTASSPSIPLYFSGYVALEVEFEQLSQRSDPSIFAQGIGEIDNEIRAIEQNRTYDRIRAAVAASPLSKEGLKTVSYNALSISVASSVSKIKVLLIAAVAGGMLGLILLVLFNSLGAYWKRNTAADE